MKKIVLALTMVLVLSMGTISTAALTKTESRFINAHQQNIVRIKVTPVKNVGKLIPLPKLPPVER
jgi:sporulation protein YlmC with PRC-barrel domain